MALERTNGRKLVLVDDDPNIRSLMTDLLQKTGEEALVFSTGTEALDALLRLGGANVEMVFVDQLLPDQLGADFCKRLRKQPGFSQRSIHLFSQLAKDPVQVARLQSETGCQAVVEKPHTEAEARSLLGHLWPAWEKVTRELLRPLPHPTYEQKGSIDDGEHGLALLLGDLLERTFTGSLTLRYHGGERVLHFDRGVICFLESNAAVDHLVEIARRKGWISEEQARDAKVLIHGKEENAAAILMQTGMLGGQQLPELYEEANRQRLASAFQMEEGAYELREGLHLSPEMPRVKIEVPGSILQNVGLALEEDHLLTALGDGAWFLRKGPDYQHQVQGLALGPQQVRLVSLLEGRTVSEVLEVSPLAAQETLEVLYTLYALRWLVRLG